MKIGKIFKECPRCHLPISEQYVREHFNDDIVDSSSIFIYCPACKLEIQLWVMARFRIVDPDKNRNSTETIK